MSAAQPQTNAQKLLLDFISEASPDLNLPHEEFVLSKFKNEALKLLNSNQNEPEAYVVLGAAYGRLYKEQEARDIFQEAFSKFQNNFFLNINYSSVLRNLGYSYQARQYAQIAFNLAEGDLDALHEVMCSCVGAGRIHEAKKWLDQWNKEKPNEKHDLNEMILGSYQVFVENDISDDVAEKYVKLAFKEIRTSKYKKKFGLIPERDEERSWVTFDYAVKADIDTIVDLNIEVVESLASNPDISLMANEGIVALVRPAIN